ncbi:MAG: hypothetical protein ACI8V2_001583 [Candidatus Latescibacterota bacterium]|jgi:hypothetical protein
MTPEGECGKEKEGKRIITSKPKRGGRFVFHDFNRIPLSCRKTRETQPVCQVFSNSCNEKCLNIRAGILMINMAQ